MAEQHLLCLGTLHTPRHDPGVMFDVAAIVLRVPVVEARPSSAPVLDLRGFLVGTGPALLEVVYPRGLAGFESVSRAVAYNIAGHNPRALARGDTLVLTAEKYLAFAWAAEGWQGCRLLHLSCDGARVWENSARTATPSEAVWSPGSVFSEAIHERLRGELLDWSLPCSRPTQK